MKLTLLTVFLALLFVTPMTAQVGIGTATPNLHAVLDLKSPNNNQGLMVPTISNAQRSSSAMMSALTAADDGLLVFDTDDNAFYYWNGSQWEPMLHGASATASGAAGGDLTGSYPNPTVGNGKITAAAIADGAITDVDINGNASISDSKLAVISTPGKVSGNAITAGTIGGVTSINTTGTITASSITTINATPTTAFTAINSAGGVAISGITSSTNGSYGIYGQGDGALFGKTNLYSYGLYGKNNFSKSFGYIGGQYGVYGENPAGIGIEGKGTTGVSGNGGTGGAGVGVYGTASGNGSFGLYSSGAAGGTTTWNASSDRRFKRNITTLDNSLQKVLQLRGVSFDWRHDEFPAKNFSHQHDMGFIAQEIKEVLPEVVLQDRDGYLAVSYEKVVPLLVEAIKQQQAEIDYLKNAQAELALIKSKIASLEAASLRTINLTSATPK